MILAFVTASIVTLISGLVGDLNTMLISALAQFFLAVAAVVVRFR